MSTTGYIGGLNGTFSLSTANNGTDDHIFHLYVREKDARAEQWEGARSGSQAAIDVFNADEVCLNRTLKFYLLFFLFVG